VRIGRWALIAAGSVVVRDVGPFALVVGVPARRIGWVGHAGVPLEAAGDGSWVCPATGRRYAEHDDDLAEA
jgi:carbonic anhydrase/acetyltransferase-like protein (isoleucine patch superfamily)